MTDAHDIITSLCLVLDAERDLREKAHGCEHDAAYFLHSEITYRDECIADFDKALSDYVDARITILTGAIK